MSRAASLLSANCVILVVAVLLASINFPYGFSEDEDGYRIVQRAQRFETDGYKASRTTGFPLYEFPIYPLINKYGVTAGKLYSLFAYTGASVLTFWLVLSAGCSPPAATLGALAFVVLPVSINGGNTIMETSQGVCLAILALLTLMRQIRTDSRSMLYACGLFLGLATSTRLDYLFLSAAAFCTLARFSHQPPRALLFAASIWLAAACLPFVIYTENLSLTTPVTNDPLAWKAARAAFAYVALLGIPAWILLVVLAFRRVRSFLDYARSILSNPIAFLFAIATVLYSVRFILLPDELEYVYVLVPLLILWLATLRWQLRQWVALVVAIALPNVIQIHFFTRDSQARVHAAFGISPGAIVQDRDVRLRYEYIYNELPETLAAVASAYGYERYSTLPTTDPGALVLFPREDLKYYAPGRRGGVFHRAACEQTILVYPLVANRGWRKLMKFTPWVRVHQGDFEPVEIRECR